ncbi:FAD-dependent monooxygenase [Streptomyces avidinii]|uniref:2-polyprenyl-6-methoxyphenol hydroxylase-like FAD-dependent oxidoreductase n=1 Tax=Streptomyces avidinii TaxID=1895 RepID=A0ABS4LHD4_STRAV|nr:FAD-dependent monooxygenase [Streptomyces avidinii]MBP2041518.1 2-polyprenyl-6-methoxyphenol hydroxylase-like FAD-dependent oxidoreductase [Streptomyces avidinii]GGZ34409.1 FAD-dependent oxidoreductase [Streptomyces avidinii]
MIDTRVPTRVPVLVVGGGTVGLAAALFLGRHGVPALVVERQPGPMQHPRALGVNERTMELFREAGLEEAVRAASVRPRTAVWKDSVPTLAESAFPPVGGHLDFRNPALAAVTPVEVVGNCPQDRIDALLLPAARAAGATVRYDAAVTSVESRSDGAVARFADGSTVHADFVVAADGASSTVRRGLDIAVEGPGVLGVPKMNIVFRADLYGRFGSVPFMTDITAPGAWAVLITVDAAERWMLHVDFDPEAGQGPEDFTDERCAELVRAAIGDPAVDVEVLSAAPWRLTARVAERFREGRVFLAGDAAHTIPPLGAFGMNTGIADAHNLAWKLAQVLHGGAAEALLDTYHTERHPVAAFTLRQAMLRLRHPALHWNPFAGAQRQEAGVANTPVVHLGYRYDSAAVVDGGAELPSTEDVAACLDGTPGSRLPHHWVTRAGERISTLDLATARWTLLAGPDGGDWCDAAAEQAEAAGLDLAVHRIGDAGAQTQDPTADWTRVAGTGPAGALLARPDGFVAWRAQDAVPDPGRTLSTVLSTLLGRPDLEGSRGAQ